MPTDLPELPCRVRSWLWWPPLVEVHDDDGQVVDLVELVETIDDDGNKIDTTTEAKQACAYCPMRVRCLDKAIKRSEEFGIWGGMGTDLRLWIRSQYTIGPEAYQEALRRAFAELDYWAGKPGAERPEEPVGGPPAVCSRCGARIRIGKKGNPIDRNGPKAKCGKASTYNRGCRCIPCVIGKSVSDAKRSVGR